MKREPLPATTDARGKSLRGHQERLSPPRRELPTAHATVLLGTQLRLSTHRPGKIEDGKAALIASEIRPRPLRTRPPGDASAPRGRGHDVLVDDCLSEPQEAIGIIGLRPEEVDLGIV